MTHVDFYALSRAVQGRLLDSFGGRYPPRPLLYARSKPAGTLRWSLIALLSLALLLTLCQLGFGALGSMFAVQSPLLLALYALFGFGVALGVLQILALGARVAALPWPSGVYAFPTRVIDARDHVLRLHPLASATRIAASGSRVEIVFPNVRFSFPANGAEAAQKAAQILEAARDRPPESQSRHTLFELDPLQEPSVTSPLGPQQPLKLGTPLWERGRWVLAAVLGAAAGAGLWQMRNTISDDRAFATAQTENTPPAYRAYLEYGKRNRTAVSTILLPRAELREAQKAGTVEAIDAFIAKNKGAAIGAEIKAARDAALFSAFESARSAGTLAALHGFASRYPDHPLGPQMAQAKHAIFTRAFSNYARSAPADGADTTRAVRRLLAYAERSGPKPSGKGLRGPVVEVRFQRLGSETLGRADIALSKNPSFNGTVSYVTRYFDATHQEQREQAIAKALTERFSRAFSPEVLTFAKGAAFDAPEDQLPEFKTPTLAITYRVEWTGGAYESKRPRGILVGLLVLFRTQLVIPGDSEVHRFKYNAGLQVPADFLRENPGLGPGPLEEQGYARMWDEAERQFSSRFLKGWFVEN
jgi:hypothetical protein